MKCLLITFCCLLLQENVHTLRLKRETPDRAAKTCILELNLEAERVMKINGLKYTPEEDKDYATYTDCYWRRMGYIHDNGDFEINNIKKMIVQSIKSDVNTKKSMHKIADLILEQCRFVSGSTIGVKAIRMENCIMKYYNTFINKYSESGTNNFN